MKTLLPISIICLASVITILLLNQIENLNDEVSNKRSFLKIFFIGNILFYISNNSDFIRSILFGIKIAGWGFPTALASARGISLLFCLIAILIVLIPELIKIDIKEYQNRIFTIYFLINLGASIIHPIPPIICFIFIFIINILIKNKKINLKFILYLNCISCLLGLITLYFAFPQSSIENIDLFDIYVKQGHPDHYLPSSYIIEIFNKKFLFAFNTLVPFFFIYFFRKISYIRKVFIKFILINY